MALVVKQWNVLQAPDAQGNYVRLVGREEGLLGWLLALIGVDATTTIEVREHSIVFTSSSLAGRFQRVSPIAAVTSVHYGFRKPWLEALLIGLLLLPVFGIGLIVGPLWYVFNKSFTLGFIESSGLVGGFTFKPSVIEGRKIDEQSAEHVHQVLCWLMERGKRA